MPDEPVPSQGDETDADARLIRRARWRLVAWSGGTTLVVLLVLGSALYLAAANSLASSGTSQLSERAELISDFITHTGRGGPGPPTEFTFGGRASGTFAFVITDQGEAFGPPGISVAGLPDSEGVLAARRAGRDVRQVNASGVPFRVLSQAATGQFGSVIIQAVQDRTAEQRTLDTLLIVLLVGGLLALAAATAVGALYARRALVPIRASLDAQRQALRRQREFAADASHELRTPLAIMRGSVDHLRRHEDRPVRDVGAALTDIEAEVSHLTSIVEDLLVLARSDSGAIELVRRPVELGDVAAEAASALEALAAGRDVRLVIDPEPAVVIGDPARLRQLVTILVDNAIRHSPRAGTTLVRVRDEGGAVTLSVEDDGPGIREKDLAHVFDRFWRAPGAPSGGTGLGLAIAAWIVARHGGRITAANGPSGGARFTAVLPPGDPRATTVPQASMAKGRRDLRRPSRSP